MSNEFMREERYIVFKASDLGNSIKGDEIRRLAREYAEQRRLKGKKPLECVVVEKDWPDCGEAGHDEGRCGNRQCLPGAQPAPSVPDGWLRAIDEALVIAHIGVANAHDTYEQAKAKLDSLIGFHVDVATDPAVNGGYKLVPIEPTQERAAQPAPSIPDGFAWPECPKRRQSHVLFDDGYEEGWAACVATIKAALAAPEAQPAPSMQEGQSQAVIDVVTERRRQIEKEGWVPEHDDEHDNGELALVAAAYAISSTERNSSLSMASKVFSLTGWDNPWWKPHAPRPDLVRAGALILAEIERLDRVTAPKPEAKP